MMRSHWLSRTARVLLAHCQAWHPAAGGSAQPATMASACSSCLPASRGVHTSAGGGGGAAGAWPHASRQPPALHIGSSSASSIQWRTAGSSIVRHAYSSSSSSRGVLLNAGGSSGGGGGLLPQGVRALAQVSTPPAQQAQLAYEQRPERSGGACLCGGGGCGRGSIMIHDLYHTCLHKGPSTAHTTMAEQMAQPAAAASCAVR